MNRRCVHVDIDLNISTEEWLRHCEGAVEAMLSVPGLEWKLWLAGPHARTAGGIYLFRDEASASAYVDGPIVERLRTLPVVRDLRIRVFVVADDLSRRTHALPALAPEPGGRRARAS